MGTIPDVLVRPEFEETELSKAETGELFSAASQPVKRIGRPEDIADVTLFFASPRSRHLTGQLVSVSGGAYMP